MCREERKGGSIVGGGDASQQEDLSQQEEAQLWHIVASLMSGLLTVSGDGPSKVDGHFTKSNTFRPP